MNRDSGRRGNDLVEPKLGAKPVPGVLFLPPSARQSRQGPRAKGGEGCTIHHEPETKQGATQSLWAHGALGLGQPSNLDFTSKAKKQAWEVTRESKGAAVRPTPKVDRRTPLLNSSPPNPRGPHAPPGESPNAHGRERSPARRPQRRRPAGRAGWGGTAGGGGAPRGPPAATGRDNGAPPRRGRGGGGVCSARGALARGGCCGAEAGAGGEGRGGGERGGGRRRRRRVWLAGGRAVGTGLVNKLRCCLGLTGPGAAAAAAAPERRCQAPAAARPSASAPASRALARSPQSPARAPRGPAADPRGM